MHKFVTEPNRTQLPYAAPPKRRKPRNKKAHHNGRAFEDTGGSEGLLKHLERDNWLELSAYQSLFQLS